MVKLISLSDFNMSLLKILSSSSFILNTVYFGLMFTSIHATNFVIKNSCGYTVWAAAVPANVSKKLEPGESLSFNHDSSSKVVGSVWARTNCYFDTEGNGKCESGDCNGHLDCASLPDAPVTLAEYTLRGSDKEDFFHISLLKGFNVPMDFRSTSASCNKAIMCAADINGLCPIELRDPGGCNHPCTVFNNDQFCCSSSTWNCGSTSYSKFFKDLCPNAHTYKVDNTTSFFACSTGTDYQVEFCPQNPSGVNTTAFNVINNCTYTVWAAALPGGGRRLDKGETWILNVASGSVGGRIWARTNCQFDDDGKGKCQTGDCGGLLECQDYGSPPNTLAEFGLNQFNNLDFIDMSNVDGFNVPMAFSSVSDECHLQIKCTADIIGECPNELKVPGGCNGPCPIFKTDEYCCNSGNCGPTAYSKFFKDRCPDVYSYPKDDATSTFTCPGGTDYKIVFCP